MVCVEAWDEVIEDVERFVVIDQGVEREPGGVLQAILVADLGSQLGVGASRSAEFG